MSEHADIVIVGAGAAGLMAAIWAGRMAQGRGAPFRVVAVDGAKTLGAKILVAGGGRCNVTHDVVDESAFFGSSQKAIRKVLKRFDVPEVVAFFRELGVTLKREETGKLFPTTDRARTVLDALLTAARDVSVEIRHPWRVESVSRSPQVNPLPRGEGPGVRASNDNNAPDHPHPNSSPQGRGAAEAHGTRAAEAPLAHHFIIRSTTGEEITASRLILATGGKSLPKSGSDGHGYSIAKSLGHSITKYTLPALVPLTISKDHFICELSGIAVDATVEVRHESGRKLISFTGPVLCTHFGLSGPAILDISRHLLHARLEDLWYKLVINWLPALTTEQVDAMLLERTNRGAASRLQQHLPERLAKALCAHAGVDPAQPPHQLTREARLKLLRTLTEMYAPVNGDRGFVHAEVTAGGVPLSEIKLETMESRITPGLHFVGEICDVDGRIGGYNFQWAWASGFVAGTSVIPAQAGIQGKH